jgi:hypothetical protein
VVVESDFLWRRTIHIKFPTRRWALCVCKMITVAESWKMLDHTMLNGHLRKSAHLFRFVLRPELSATTGDDIVNWYKVSKMSCQRLKSSSK